MQTASFPGFIETIFYILMFYHIFKFLAKIFLPLLVKKVVQKAGENFQKQQGNPQDNSWNATNTKDNVTYTNPSSQKPRETKKVGDYVDYEEIE